MFDSSSCRHFHSFLVAGNRRDCAKEGVYYVGSNDSLILFVDHLPGILSCDGLGTSKWGLRCKTHPNTTMNKKISEAIRNNSDTLSLYDLRELPECIGDICNLRVIDISNDDHQLGYDGAINELSEAIGKLKNLEELDGYGLQDLKQFPPSFARLSRLKRLNTMDSPF